MIICKELLHTPNRDEWFICQATHLDFLFSKQKVRRKKKDTTWQDMIFAISLDNLQSNGRWSSPEGDSVSGRVPSTLVVNRSKTVRSMSNIKRLDLVCWQAAFIHSHLSPLWAFGEMQCLIRSLSQKFIQGTHRVWGLTLGGGGKKRKAYIYTVEWCNLHEIPVNRERKPSGAVD